MLTAWKLSYKCNGVSWDSGPTCPNDDVPVATNQLARAKDSCDERRRCASMRENAFYDFVRAVFV